MLIRFQTCRYELLPRLIIGGAPLAIADGGDPVDLLVLAAREYTPEIASVRPDDPAVRVLPLVDDGFTPPTADETRAIRHVLAEARRVHDLGGTVAFTCLAGQNRSALLGALFLVERGIPHREALDVTARARLDGPWGRRSPALEHAGYRSVVLTWQPETPRRAEAE